MGLHEAFALCPSKAVGNTPRGEIVKRIGIYNPYLNTKGGGEKVCLALASVLSQQPQTKVSVITHRPAKLKPFEDYFQIDLSRVSVEVVPYNTFFVKLVHKLPAPSGVRNLLIDTGLYYRLKRLSLDIFINNYYHSNMPNVGKHGIYMCMFPQKIDDRRDKKLGIARSLYRYTLHRLYGLLTYRKNVHPIYTYDLVTANSRYTQGYIKKYWGIDSTILYPICDDMYDKKLNNKRKVILNVARFFENVEGSHHKRQDFLLDTFKEMEDLHKKGWELHFAGSVADDIGGLKYTLFLLASAQGYPVYFHFNTNYENLKKLYNQANVYWHATGYGSDSQKHPERQEHFGISTVEAMSTGTIPVVINSAGQKESVIHGENGYLWHNAEELVEFTEKVATLSSQESTQIQSCNIKKAKRFSASAFRDKVLEIFNQVTS
jgi:glycosyltransferase involved in cell wall biosynthesis